jgi:glyoxylase-like metal-dependent hydrolase (beta-lactamase superfamily II)
MKSKPKSLRDGQTLTDEQAPSLGLRVLHTPGHTMDSVSLYDKAAGIAFVDDTIFKGSIGTDQYPGGNRAQLLRSIQTVIFLLPENTVLYSGHSAPTTVGAEKERYRI